LTPGNIEFVQVLCSMSVWTGGVALVLAIEDRRLTPEQKERDWLPATRDATVLGSFLFGVLYAAPGLLVHFIRTRRLGLGIALGLLIPCGLFAIDAGAELGAEAAIDALGL
jgi:hypothetical protein